MSYRWKINSVYEEYPFFHCYSNKHLYITKEWQKKEKELSYYLQLYNEIQTRDNVSQILACLDIEIDELVETLKRMK